MDYKRKISHVAETNALLPDRLNTFFAHFEDNTVPPTWPATKDCGLSFSVADVSETFKRVNPRKAAGPDGIPSHVLRACADQLAGVFTDIFNHSLSQSAVPTSFKMATIGPPGWRSGLGHCIAVLTAPPESLGSRPGSVAAGRDREVRGATHNWHSVVRGREGLAGRDILVSSRSSDSCGGPGAVRANQGGQVHGVSSDTLVRLASGLEARCVKKQYGWLGCASEDAWLSTFVSPEPVREL
ncbi:uncharacterized protein ACWYII_015679 [Salvelinus alpinus]